MDGVLQVQLDERHHLNFAEGVKAMLRLDPDYLMVGEIRDGLSAHAAINAALSGRVLLSTIHSRDAVGTLTALRNWGLADHEIAEALTVVVAQRLVRRLCPHCKRPAKLDSNEAAWLRAVKAPMARETWKPVGCEKCNHLGYFGRTGVFEFWQLDGTDYDLILAHADEHTIREHLARREHDTLMSSGMAKVAEGVTSVAELRRIVGATFPAQLYQQLVGTS
jgi:type II secretory ATPase GspE/PulE/Tfp pilus assembly ATPase PilB-like protein